MTVEVGMSVSATVEADALFAGVEVTTEVSTSVSNTWENSYS